MIINFLLVLALIAFVVFCYLAYQDPRYAVQDPFLMRGFAIIGAALIVLVLFKIFW